MILKNIKAREFETFDNELFDKYYDMLFKWCMCHRWHFASAGAIIADLYFQLVGENIEISWNNQDSEKDVKFKYILGGIKIP